MTAHRAWFHERAALDGFPYRYAWGRVPPPHLKEQTAAVDRQQAPEGILSVRAVIWASSLTCMRAGPREEGGEYASTLRGTTQECMGVSREQLLASPCPGLAPPHGSCSCDAVRPSDHAAGAADGDVPGSAGRAHQEQVKLPGIGDALPNLSLASMAGKCVILSREQRSGQRSCAEWQIK